MAKTKTFTISSDDAISAYLCVNMKVNSPKQAKARFLKKYEPVLFGYWLFSITDSSGLEISYFEVNKTVSDMANSKTVNKTVNDNTNSKAVNKTVNREQQYMIDRDGMIHKWSGRGRIPRGFEYYEMPNISAMPLREVQELQKRIVNPESVNKTVNKGKHYTRKRRTT